MSREVFDVAVVGGGLHGLSAALHLARARQRVIVLERSWVGRHASGATAAGVRTLNRDVGELDLALESLDMWHSMEALVGDHCGFQPHGQICVAETPDDMAHLEQGVSRLHANGYRHEEVVDARELRRRVPAISSHCLGGSIAAADGSADPHRTLSAFRRAAQAAGVVIREGCGVSGIQRRGDEWLVQVDRTGNSRALGQDERVAASAIVNAAGAWGARVAALVGDDIPLGTKASMMIVTERLAPFIDPVVSAKSRPLSFKQTTQGTLVIGGGLQGLGDLDRETAAVRMKILSAGARAATEMFPCVRDVRVVRVWAGLEAKTSDLLPVIGPSLNAPRVFHAFGYSGHGFELVPVVGAALADLVVHGSTRRAISALGAARLAQPH